MTQKFGEVKFEKKNPSVKKHGIKPNSREKRNFNVIEIVKETNFRYLKESNYILICLIDIHIIFTGL